MKSGLACLLSMTSICKCISSANDLQIQCMAAWDSSSSLFQVTTGIYLGTTIYQENFYDTFEAVILHPYSIMNFNRDLQHFRIMKRAQQNMPFMCTLIVERK